MGQYHFPVNLTKKQKLDPHKFDDGLKLREFGCSAHGTMTALAYLLASSIARGGGDMKGGDHAGTWAGDKIAIIGDYSEKGDIPGMDAAKIYDEMLGYEDVSDAVLKECEDCRGG